MWNELAQFGHVTYGTLAEVETRALRQTAAWKRKLYGPKGNPGWRKPKARSDEGVVLVVEGEVPGPVRS